MKLIERFRAHQTHKHLRKLRRQLENQSLDPDGTGWLIHEATPDTLYLLGYSLPLDTEKTVLSYTLPYLESQYVALKAGLARLYPDFIPSRVKLEVEVFFASSLAADTGLMARAVPRLRTYQFADDEDKTVDKLDGLEIPVVLDGDHVTLSISRSSYFEGYGFFVYDHPDSRESDGVWCRPTPDLLAALSREKTL